MQYRHIISALLLGTPLICLAEQKPVFAGKPHHITLSHIESKGIGYEQGYSTLEGFFTAQSGPFRPFLDLRGHVFNDGRWAGNAGMGTRYIFDTSRYMLGINGYYDYRKTKHLQTDQVGVGFEAFLNAWEFRTNGYLPVGNKSKTLSNDLTSISFKAFSGNNILIDENYSKKNVSAMRGFDAEIGLHPCRFNHDYDFFLGASGYYFNATNGETTWGGKLRAKAEITSYFFIELSNSYDHVFRNRFQGSVTLSIPLGRKKGCVQKQKTKSQHLSNDVMCWRALLPVERQEIIVIHTRKMHYTIDPVAIDQATGRPFFVLFVDNTNTNPTPNGTFENPFANLTPADNALYNAQAASSPGDIIYIFPGSSSPTSQNGMSHGFTLQNNQRFLGSGISNRFLTTKGLLTVSPQTTTAPSISINNGIVISLSSNNEVSGTQLYALGATAVACIGVGAAPIDGTTITRNLLTGNSASTGSIGIDIEATLGGTFTIDQNTITSQASTGVAWIPTNGPVVLSFTNNTVSNTNSHGLLVGTDPFIDPITTLFVENNIVTNASTTGSCGMLLQANRNVTATVINNTCNSNNFCGILLFFPTSSVITCDVRNNVTNNNQAGIEMAYPTGAGCMRFNDNIAIGNSLHPFFWTSGSLACQVELPVGNIGSIDTGSLAVELVPAGTCGFGP